MNSLINLTTFRSALTISAPMHMRTMATKAAAASTATKAKTTKKADSKDTKTTKAKVPKAKAEKPVKPVKSNDQESIDFLGMRLRVAHDWIHQAGTGITRQKKRKKKKSKQANRRVYLFVFARIAHHFNNRMNHGALDFHWLTENVRKGINVDLRITYATRNFSIRRHENQTKNGQTGTIVTTQGYNESILLSRSPGRNDLGARISYLLSAEKQDTRKPLPTKVLVAPYSS